MRTAAVIGGGIGGLATAVALDKAGWHVTVFERAAEPPRVGTASGVWPGATHALDRIGLGDAARAAGKPQPAGVIRTPSGTVLGRLKVGRDPVRLLTRPALLGVLASVLPSDVVRFGVPADLASGESFDLVVGADGINSGVRRALFPSAVRHSGAIAWRGTVDVPIEVGGETWGRGAKVGLTPQADGRTNWYVLARVPEGGEPPDLRNLLAGWHDPIPAVLTAASEILRHPLEYLDPLPSYVRGNVALVGDAAHAMTPDLGQGACQAIIDGVTLGSCLAGDDLIGGLRAYDRLRRRRTQRMAAMALRLNKLAQARRFTGVRDTALRIAVAV